MGAPYFSKSFGSHIPIIFSWRQEINIKIYLNNTKIFRKKLRCIINQEGVFQQKYLKLVSEFEILAAS